MFVVPSFDLPPRSSSDVKGSFSGLFDLSRNSDVVLPSDVSVSGSVSASVKLSGAVCDCQKLSVSVCVCLSLSETYPRLSVSVRQRPSIIIIIAIKKIIIVVIIIVMSAIVFSNLQRSASTKEKVTDRAGG